MKSKHTKMAVFASIAITVSLATCAVVYPLVSSDNTSVEPQADPVEINTVADEAITTLSLEPDGSAEAPYIINSADDFDLLRSVALAESEEKTYFSVTEDIDLSSVPDFEPIGDGRVHATNIVLEGNSKTISGLTILYRTDRYYTGLFGYLGEGVEIKNLTLTNVSITGNDSVGAIAGYNKLGTITNCLVSGNISGKYFVGGICGNNFDGYVTSCTNGSAITAVKYGGGIVGMNANDVTSCNNGGNINASTFAGGICGGSGRNVISCNNAGAVTAVDGAGGIVGYQTHTEVRDCTNRGTITATTNAGGIIGSLATKGAVKDCQYMGATKGVGVAYSGSTTSNVTAFN